jgi:hypothetical protein
MSDLQLKSGVIGSLIFNQKGGMFNLHTHFVIWLAF